MRICMINDERFPSKAADTINVVRTAAGLGQAGATVELVIPRLRGHNADRDELCEYYGVDPTFTLTRLAALAPRHRPAVRPEKLSHALLAPWHALRQGADVIYSRNFVPLAVAQMVGRPWVFETYRRFVEESPRLPALTRWLPRSHALGVIAHSQRCANNMMALGFQPPSVLRAYSGYQEDEVLPRLDQRTAREACGLPLDRPIVLHLGNIDPFVRIDTLFAVAQRLPAVLFLFVGGHAPEHQYWNERARALELNNVQFVAHQPPSQVRRYVYVADALAVAPRNADLEAPSAGPSLSLFRILPGFPMKIITYLASGVPVFAPDLPYLTELLRHRDNAFLYPVDSPERASQILQDLLGDSGFARALAQRSQARVQGLTWANRARTILTFLESRLRERAALRAHKGAA